MADDAVRVKAQNARKASLRLAQASDASRQAAVRVFADLLEDHRDRVEQANAEDVADGKQAVAADEMTQAALDRLTFKGPKLSQTAEALDAVAEQTDPVGQTVRATRLDEGLRLYQVRVPIGVIACAFESRPDAGAQMAALAMRSGNAILLKGGSEAARSNRVLAELARQALSEAGLPEDGVVLLEDRAELQALLDLDELVDLIIPRGSSSFVRFVQENTRIPVLGHADGVCHTYIDAAADLDQAIDVCVDAKTDYPAACNATECFLVHQAIAPELVPALVEALGAKGVEVRADLAARKFAPQTKEATGEDWGHEWGDLVCGLRVVGGLEEAIDHINTYGSAHTEAILTEDRDAADRFVQGVDAAGVYVNASTRFADGYRYGLGAEVGISTGKVHARGPVGLEGLTTTKWVLEGQGHRAGAYQGADAKAFDHEALDEAYTLGER